MTLFIPALAWAQSPTKIEIQIFSRRPARTRDQIVKIIPDFYGIPTSTENFGRLADDAYIFDMYMLAGQANELSKQITDRILVNFDQDHRSQRSALTKSNRYDHVIVKVFREFARPEDELRIYQTTARPDELMAKVIASLSAAGANFASPNAIRPEKKDGGLELRFELLNDQLVRLLTTILSEGPWEARYEHPPQSKTTTHVRFVVDRSTRLNKNLKNQGLAGIYDFKLSADHLPLNSAEILRSQLEQWKARPSGEIAIGQPVEGKPTFQFDLARDKLAPLALGLISRGNLRVTSSPDDESQQRDVSVHVDISALRYDFVAPTQKTIETTAITPDQKFSRPLSFKNVPKSEPALRHEIFVDDTSEVKTYASHIEVLGLAPTGAKMSQNGQAIEVATSGEFQFTIKDLEKGETKEAELENQTPIETSTSVYAVTRYPRSNFALTIGYLPHTAEKEGLFYFARPTLRSWISQRWGFTAAATEALNDPTPKEPGALRNFDIDYRWTRGIQEVDDSLIAKLSFFQSTFGSVSTEFLGLGLEDSREMPSFLSALVNWIPIFRYPQRIDYGAMLYPLALTSQSDANWVYTVYVEPKLYFTPRFALLAHFQLTHLDYVQSDRSVSSQFILSQIGLGYLF